MPSPSIRESSTTVRGIPTPNRIPTQPYQSQLLEAGRSTTSTATEVDTTSSYVDAEMVQPFNQVDGAHLATTERLGHMAKIGSSRRRGAYRVQQHPERRLQASSPDTLVASQSTSTVTVTEPERNLHQERIQLTERVERHWERSEYPERLDLTIAWNELLRAERLQRMRDAERSNRRGAEGTVVVVVGEEAPIEDGRLCPECSRVVDWMESFPEI